MRFAATLIVALLAAPLGAEQLPSTGELLERYARGDFAAFTPPKDTNDLARFRQALEHDTEAWLRRADARRVRTRQLTAATIALETARASFDLDWGEGRRLIEWASALLRKAPADDSERLWHLAALSLMEGAFDSELILEQQKLVVPRFANEPRFVLAVIVVLEGDTWPDPDRGEPWDDNEASLADAYQMNAARRNSGQSARPELRLKSFEYQRRTKMRTAISALEDLSNSEGTRADVLLRLGFLHMRLRHFEIAMEQFEEVLTLTKDPFLVYLAQFLLGMGKEHDGDLANALAAYRAALAVIPRAQSASFALAELLFLDGHRAEAARLIDDAITTPVAEDPWRTYQSGDFRFWRERLNALQQALK
jgi:tetratricopeptide (TPR) repeat protein